MKTARIPVPPRLRERLRELVQLHGSLRAAAEAIDVEPRHISQLLPESATAREETLVFVEVRLQAAELWGGVFADRQELAELACDLVVDAATAAELARLGRDGLTSEGRTSALFRLVQGVPARDGRVLVDGGVDAKGHTVWRVQAVA